MKRYHPIFSILFLFYLGNAIGQNDSLRITLDKLTWKDIQQQKGEGIDQKVSSASRSLQNIREIPLATHVISGEEIRQNGYITLTDALKMLPGIRISQPGSAAEGELFMMRGLIGNSYAKILINGIPIKPYMVNGLPIGAQLPIQQADRIEVIYGPAAALYGADASTGIINIVMEDSERPIFTNASLHVGSDGYSSLNVALGGKLGKGKDVLKFRIYGSNTRMADRRVKYDRRDLYNIENYILGATERLEELQENPNFRGTVENPILNELPHQSRSFGVQANYKFFELSFKNIHRRDHSALGQNPLAVSFANPLTSIGEDIMEGSLSAKKQFEKWSFQSTAGFVNYDMDNRSSTIYLNPSLDFIFDSLGTFTGKPEAFIEQVHNNFFNRTRFSFSNSFEYYMEQTFKFPLFEKGELTTGARFQGGDGQPFVDFQPTPVQADNIMVRNLKGIFSDPSYNEFSGFAQLFLPSNRWNILLGAQYLIRKNPEYSQEIKAINPRLALLYKASKKMFFRGSFGTAFKIPSPYLNATTYTVRPTNFNVITTGISRLDSEKTFSFETGLRWEISKKAFLDMGAYFTKTTDFVTYDILRAPIDSLGLTIGYFNSPNTVTQLYGIQGMLQLKNIIPKYKLNAQISWNYSKGKENFFPPDQNNQGIFEQHIAGINSVRAYPTFIGQVRLDFSPLEKLKLTLDNVFMTRSTTRNIILIESNIENTGNENNIYSKGYYTLDVTSHYQLSKSFSIYTKFINLFNRKYAGIDAYNHPDILRYNPQSLFIYRIGVNYNLN